MAHDTYTHSEDGRVCIVLDDCWFVPLDAGGEGFVCERTHGPTQGSDEEAVLPVIERVDAYTITVDGHRVRATPAQENVLRNMDAAGAQRFLTVMGLRS